MPIYEYQCQKCQVHFERRQSISEAPLTLCETCGGELKKQVSLSGFQFKGAGWYVTDYAAKKDSGADKSGAGEKGETGTKNEIAGTSEKSSSAESTTKPDTASNTNSDAPSVSKTDSAAKKE